MKRPPRKGPLVAVAKTLRKSSGPYDIGVVELVCGHRVSSNSTNRARCNFCYEKQLEALREMAQDAQDMGLYDE